MPDLQKRGQICSGELILEMDVSCAVMWEGTLMFEEPLVSEALGEQDCVKYMQNIALVNASSPTPCVCCWCGVFTDPEPSLSRN